MILFFELITLKQFNGSITTLATDRFTASNAFAKVGVLQGLNQAMQCTYSPNSPILKDLWDYLPGVGAILIAPLIKRFNTRSVLASAIFGFGILTIILLICDGMYSSLSSLHTHYLITPLSYYRRAYQDRQE